MDYDVIVCGAGPSGAMAALTAAQAGLKVALLEKRCLPRHKPCGGGTPMVMQRFLQELAPDAFVESNVTQMRHTWNFSDPYLAEINPDGADCTYSIWMMQRPIFDNALAQQAAKAGADLKDGVAVRSIEIENDGVRVTAQTVKADGETGSAEFTLNARYLIGADGANGVTAKAANLRQQRAIALALEIEHPYAWGQGHPDLRPEVLHLEYGIVPRGYAWIFPKADHLNIGAGLFRPKGGDSRSDRHIRAELQQAIFQYMDSVGLAHTPERIKFYGHPLPLWSGRQQLNTANGRILLAGDAAGLINPLFGDGILHAVKSGMIAANCIANGTPYLYSDRIHAEFAADFDAALLLSKFFYRFPQSCYKYGVKNPRATRIATQLLAGELSFTDLAGRSIRRIVTRTVRDRLPLPSWG